MSLDADALIDRRRLKRALAFWRIAALAVAVAAGAVLFGGDDIDGLSSLKGDYVAELRVSGVITENPDRLAALADVAEDSDAKALLVHIDSPGGTVVGGESLYKALRRVAEEKPVVATMAELATSGGYMTALGADRIYAHAGSVTGSIGVLLQTADMTGLMDKMGVKPEVVKSSALKAQPNPMEPFSDEARDAVKGLIMDMHGLFIDMVAERRGMTRTQVLPLADGRIFTGRQAVDNGLVDAIGGVADARSWLKAEHGIDDDVPLKRVGEKKRSRLLSELAGDAMAGMAGTIVSFFGKMVSAEGVRLDGLLSVWHPGQH